VSCWRFDDLDTGKLKERQKLGEIWDTPYDLVFPNTIGKIQKPSYLSQGIFQRLLKKAGLPEIRYHDLRHTAATMLLSRGVNPKVVSEMLDHSQISITLDIYSQCHSTHAAGCC
jgi:integrase